MANALKQQVEWFRLFLECYCVATYFPVEVEEEMRRIGVSRPEVMAVVEGCRIVECDHSAGITKLTLQDVEGDDEGLRVTVNVENDVLRIGVLWVSRLTGD